MQLEVLGLQNLRGASLMATIANVQNAVAVATMDVNAVT